MIDLAWSCRCLKAKGVEHPGIVFNIFFIRISCLNSNKVFFRPDNTDLEDMVPLIHCRTKHFYTFHIKKGRRVLSCFIILLKSVAV